MARPPVPRRRRVRTQQFMVEFANRFERRFELLIIAEPAAHFANLIAAQARLPPPSSHNCGPNLNGMSLRGPSGQTAQTGGREDFHCSCSRRWSTWAPLDSEVRLCSPRHRGDLAGGFIDVFGADQVRPSAHGGPISDGRRPRHGEDAFILDREMELQHLAPVIGVEVRAWRPREFSLSLRSMASLASS